MDTAEKLFADIDTNGNKKLEMEEVREFSRRMLHSVKPDAQFDEEAFQKNFQNMDKNDDGTISKDELFQSLVEKARQAQAMWWAREETRKQESERMIDDSLLISSGVYWLRTLSVCAQTCDWFKSTIEEEGVSGLEIYSAEIDSRVFIC